ncbi:hypothetical protein AGMMS49965_23320 [Bacteroidia bacterium]|nr:hypothetical protein AGMMS49965_23320 [Bacteroidia bacterium]
MKRLKFVLVMFAAAVAIASCGSSGKKALSKGDYYAATIQSVNKLRSSPEKEDVQYTLTQAYPLAVADAKRAISNAQASNNPARFDVIVTQYERLNKMADEIFHCLKANELIPSPEYFQSELANAQRDAAEQSYNLGVAALQARTIEQARVAYQHFLKADKYMPGYQDVLSKINEAMYAATLRVIVEAPVTPTNFQISADFFYINLLEEFGRTNKNKLVRFYTPEEAKNENMRDPHQYIVLDFAEFTVGNIRETNNTFELKNDSVPTTVTVNGQKVTGMTTVTAKFTQHTREIISGGTLNVRLLDATNNRALSEKRFSGSYTWETSWGNFSGDERALSNRQIEICKREAILPPPNQDMFLEFTKPIYTQAVSFVRSFYSRWYYNY